MIKYSYQILKYTPDQIIGEFINVGIVMYSEEGHFLKAKMTSNGKRIKSIFSSTDIKSLIDKLKKIEALFNDLSIEESKSIVEITSSILTPDMSAIMFDKERIGIDINLDFAFDKIFDRYIQIESISKEDKKAINDASVWKEHYKKYFDKHEISKHLHKKSIHTSGDVIHFDHAVKNGIWHYIEPVSFIQNNESLTKEKVYKWIGKMYELNKTNEEFALYFLTQLPQNPELKFFIKDRLTEVKSDNFKVNIIEPENAESEIKELADHILNH